jgi:lysophospholipase L1-like esterase
MRNGWRDGWVPSLAKRLPQPAKLVNLGVGGSLLRDAMQRQLPRAIEAQPDLVTVWLVVNDALSGVRLDDYGRDLNRLLGELRTKTKATIAIGNAPFPAAHLDPWGIPEILRRTIVGSWNRVIASAARTHGAVLVDLYANWKLADHPEYIGPDRLHPTAAGYGALTETFLQGLQAHGVL